MEHDKPAKKPVDYDELFPGRFLKAGLLKGKKVTVTISAVDTEEMPDRKGTKTKGIVSLRETKMQWALNSTNGQCLKAMFGRHVQEWIGHRVTICPEKDRFGAEMVDAIRVYGSPELENEITLTIDLGPRRAQQTRVLHCAPENKSINEKTSP